MSASFLGGHSDADSRRAGLRVAVVQFALSGLAVLLVIGTVGAVALRRAAQDEALRDATTLAESVAQGVIQGELTPEVVAGDPEAIAGFDQAIRQRVLGDAIVRVKIWAADGRVVYSDEGRIIGQRFPISPHLAETLARQRPHAEISKLTEDENGFERLQVDRLVEVYLPIVGPGGATLVAETYQSTDRVDEGNSRIWRTFAPVLLLALAVLALAQLPLAWWLGRRVRAQYRERDALTRRADEAAERERRRIAHDLHDGVVQDLAGASYDLAAAAERVDTAERAELGRTLRRSARIARESVSALRTLLVELYQQDDRGSLADEIEAVAGPLRARGVEVVIDVADVARIGEDDEALLYRAAREALRNVERHASASRAGVFVKVEAGVAELVVEDDGAGMVAGALQRTDGHLGLALLAETATARGGGLEIDSEPGRGTRLVLRLPLVTPVDAPAAAPDAAHIRGR